VWAGKKWVRIAATDLHCATLLLGAWHPSCPHVLSLPTKLLLYRAPTSHLFHSLAFS
jgi:hypothetical protein